MQLSSEILIDYRQLRFAVVDCAANTVSAGCNVPRMIVWGITLEAVKCLELLESDRYNRQDVVVEISVGRAIKAALYIAGEVMFLRGDEWDFED